MKNLAILAAIILLAACGTTTPLSLSQVNEPIPAGKARVVITRDTSLLYMAAAADVRLNGTKIASLGRGGSAVHDIAKGRNTLTVSTLGSFGQYTTTFDAAPQKSYEFLVSPRKEAMGVGAAFGLIGDAVSASNNDQSGYFQINPKSAEQ